MPMPIIHPNWDRPPVSMVDGYSLEITAKERDALLAAAGRIKAETPVAITFLPGEEVASRIAATCTARELGLEPMPHFSARRIRSMAEFEHYVERVTVDAGVKRCFVVAGDPAGPEGPFADSSSLIETGIFERNGITAIGIGGHPEGHPHMTESEGWAVLDKKCSEIKSRGMAPLIVTQFTFDADAVLSWILQLRARGIDAPVRIGVPGPAGIKRLLKFAAHCGVGASVSVLAKYGISLSMLIGKAGPDKQVDAIARGLISEHGPVRLHFYPFGGIEATLDWIDAYDARPRAGV
jgi:methylenetetrahydrofolate reductase (NADPH)